MKKSMKTKILIAILLVFVFVFNTVSCGETSEILPQTYTYTKDSQELLHFESSDEDLDFFLNDYFKRHSGWIDENGVDQKVASVTAGVNAVQFFWQEWNSMAYYWHNASDGFATDRIEGIRKILSNIISTQIDEHKIYGGVVPEIASRKHIEKVSLVAQQALKKAGIDEKRRGETLSMEEFALVVKEISNHNI